VLVWICQTGKKTFKKKEKKMSKLNMENAMVMDFHAKNQLLIAYKKEKKFNADIKNSAYIKLLKSLENGMIIKDFKATFYKACKSVLVDISRADINRKKRYAFENEIINDLTFTSNYFEDLSSLTYEKSQVKECLLDILKTLKKGRESVVFTLFYIKNYKQTEIAEKLKITKVAVFKRLLKLENVIGKNYDMNALRKAFIGIDSTSNINPIDLTIDNSCFSVNAQKTSVKQVHDTRSGQIMEYDKDEIDEFIPAKNRNEINLNSYIKQTAGYCSGLNSFDIKDIGIALKKDLESDKYFYDAD
jgi:RNA polymerase sigma factor (sigma-70 family)